MQRYKRILILLGVLVVALAVTFGVSRYQEAQEKIAASDEIILEIPTEDVTALSWVTDDASFSFHRDGTWSYDDDKAFPVSEEKMEELLSPFASLGAAFIIEDVEDFDQYGLEEPTCTITSPGSRTPVLMASAEESPVPTMTGVPSSRPVALAASAVTVPAMSVTTWPSGNWSGRQNRSHISSRIRPSM